MENAIDMEKAAIEFDAAKLSPFGITPAQAEKLFTTSLEKETLRRRLALVEAEYRAALPYATDRQMAALEEALRGEKEVAVGNQPNVDFILTDAQQARLEMVKAERRAWCAANKGPLVTALLANEAEKLVSYRLKAGAKRTLTTLRFERRHTVDKVGLIAAICAAAEVKE